MRFCETPISGAFAIEAEPYLDERGSFAAIYDAAEFTAHGIEVRFERAAVSVNRAPGTLRGLHYQAEPYAEAKLVRCSKGAIFDVLVDLRAGSATYGHWHAEELTDANQRLLFIPEGLAHGFQTLTPDAEVTYLLSKAYAPDHARGLRWDDPAVGIAWPPAAERVISARDRALPLLDAQLR